MAAKFLKILFLSLLLAGAPFFCFAENESKPADYFNIPKGCGITIKESASGEDLVCKPWQNGVQGSSGEAFYSSCWCMPECLTMPKQYYYYDNPVTKHRQTDTNAITLPVVLAWDHVEAWKFEDGKVKWVWPGLAADTESLKSKYFGAQSYLLEIDNGKNQVNNESSFGGIYRKILTAAEFNSAEPPAYPCFFNSDTVIRWRVRPCCKEDGSYCMPEENAEWWTFRTSPAPEPIWPKDPDWTGNDDAKNVSFKDAKLKWCHAAVSESKQPYNENQDLSLSYQMRVYSNENEVVLSGNQIPAKFSELAQWLQKDVPALANPLACHYLEKQQNNTCKPDTVNPLQPKTVRNSDHFYYWSHKELPNSDRALFTKNLTYYWQLRRCFNNPNAGEESCNSNSEKNWGQRWAFTTKDETISAPEGISPKNDNNFNNNQTASLIGIPATLNWSVPNGANSFAYDIQKITGNNSTSLVGNERRTTKSQIFFTKGAADSDSESQNIELEIDTPYKWRVKSCWPSLPVGDVCDSAWSAWYYFRTTGRAPKAELMKPQAAAVSVQMPVALQWEAVPGAKSYIVTFNDEKIITANNQYTVDYPKINQNQAYTWKVQTCADNNGSKCGPASEEIRFMTAALGASQKSNYPEGTIDNSQLIYNFSWEPVAGAHYYKFTLDYAEKSDQETNNKCETGIKIEKIVKESSAGINKNIGQLYCLGKYEWNVLACMDQACNDKGATPDVWQFNFVAGGKEIKKGEAVLAVCGLTNDNPNTDWDDRESCGIKHLLLTVEQVINFFLFKMSMILLPLLIMGTGAMYYTQFGGAELLEKVKLWWKFIGIGYAILFFAWMLVGIMLSLFGYSGVWWNV